MPDELNLGSVPDADNASLDYKAAGEVIDDNTRAWKTYYDDYGGFKPPLTAGKLVTARVIVAENQAALARVVAARGKTAGPWNDGQAYAGMATLADMKLNPERGLCNLLMLAAMVAHSDGDDEQAVGWVDDILAISDAGQNRPSLIAHLVAVGAGAVATETTCTIASDLHVGKNRLSRATILRFINRLEDERAMDAGRQIAWRSERIMGLNAFRGFADGTMVANGQSGGKAFGYLIKPFVLEDARLYAAHLQGVMLADAAPDWPAAQKLLPTSLPNAVAARPYLHLLTSILLPSLDKAIKVDYRARTQRRLAAVALAARLFAADHHGQLPSSLGDLVPAYLPAVPMDPMSGNPMLFKSDPPRVYSVGDDGIDDGGVPVDPTIPNYKHPRGDIVVFLVTQPPKKSTTVPALRAGRPGKAGG
jgi:hypothetical protein